MPLPCQRGSTLLDVLLASAIGAFVTLASLALMRTGFALSAKSDLAAQNITASRALIDRLQSRARSAWSIFIPTSDVLSQNNSDGHEVDFYTQTANHVPFFWAERFDRATHALTAYSYANVGDVATPTGERVPRVTAFWAKAATLEDLQRAGSPIYDPLFTSATLQNASVAFVDQVGVRGGNAIVVLSITVGALRRECTLSSGTAPTGFTVVVPY